MVEEAVTSEVEDLAWIHCATSECRGARLAEEEHCLLHAEPKGRAAQLTRFHRGRPLDVRGVVVDSALWHQILEAVPIDPAGGRRFPLSHFEDAVIDADVDLDDARFSRHALFHGTRFRGRVSLRGMTVFGQSRFSGAVFEGPVVFGAARLNGPSWFAGTRFEREVSFQGTKFAGPATFADATFVEDLTLKEAVFGSFSVFDRAKFGCHTDLSGITCEADIRLEGATFVNPPDVDGAVFKGKAGVPGVAARRPVRWWGRPLAEWNERAKAALFDLLMPFLIIAGCFAVTPVLHALKHTELVVPLEIAGVVVALGLFVRDLVEQGYDGQTRGKRRVGLRLVSERDRRPVGPMRSVVRYTLHLLDTLPLLAGWFWPLRDDKHQTIADKLMGTVVVLVGESFQRTNAEGAAPVLTTAPS